MFIGRNALAFAQHTTFDLSPLIAGMQYRLFAAYRDLKVRGQKVPQLRLRVKAVCFAPACGNIDLHSIRGIWSARVVGLWSRWTRL